MQEGIPETIVNDVLEDRYGYIWVATQKGFARFDGTAFDAIRLKQDAPVLESFMSLSEAPDGDIWAGEGDHGGLVHYDRQTGSVRHFLASPEPRRGLSEPEVFTVEALKDGRIAAFTTNRAQEAAAPTGKCLDLFDPATDTFASVSTPQPRGRLPGFSCDPLILSLPWFFGPTLQDRRGALWVGTTGGAYRLRPGEKHLPVALPSFERSYPIEGYKRLDTLVASSASLASLTRVGNDADMTELFEVRDTTSMLLVGVGEFNHDGSADAGWLENARGDTLWAMDVLRSAWAGGRRSNKLIVDTITVAAGRYRLRYRSDEGWSFGDWRTHAPPLRPEWWGLRAIALPREVVAPPTITGLQTAARVAPRYPTALVEGRDGTIWVGTRRGEIYRYDADSANYTRLDVVRTDPFGLDASPVRVLYEDEEGTMWVGTWDRGLYRVDPRTGSVQHFQFSAHVDPEAWPLADHIRSIASDPGGTVWVGTESGLVHLDPRTGGLNIYGRRFVANAPPAVRILRVLRGSEGTLWVSTESAGLARLDRRANGIRVLTHTAGESYDLPARRIVGMVEGADGTVWVGSDRGLVHYDHAKGAITAPDFGAFSSVFNEEVVPLLAEPNGDLWLVDRARREVYRYNRGLGTLRTYPAPDDGFPFGPAPLLRNVDGAYWFATSEGLYRFDPVDGTFFPYPFRPAARTGGETGRRILPVVSDSLNQREIVGLHVAPDGRLWLGTDEGGLDLFDPRTETFASYRSAKRGLLNVWTIADRGDGTLWLGGHYGLSRFDPATGAHVRLARSGEPLASRVRSLSPDQRGFVWASTDRGLLRYDPERGTTRFFGAEYGLGKIFRHLRLSSGHILFLSREGLVVVDPQVLAPDTHPPHAVIESLTAEGRGNTETIPLLDRSAVSLPHHLNDVGLTYAGLDYSAAESVAFAYRLDGYDEQWQDVGTQRTARYPNLPPGHYTFRVRASNADGYWSDKEQTGAAVSVIVRPPWWETVWVRLLGISALVALVYAAYRYRLARLLTVERLRLRIAADLHDDLGSGLTQVSLMSELARRSAQSSQPGAAAEWAEKIGNEARMLAERMRDVVWMIRPDEEAWDALEARMRDVGAALLDPQGVAFIMHGHVERTVPRLPLEIRRHVLLAYKEVLNNAARHAGASRVEVFFRLTRSRLVVRVCDDGVGFDVPRTGGFNGGGNGLRNLHQRAEALGGKVVVDSAPGAGTCVALVVPLQRRGWQSWKTRLRTPLEVPPPPSTDVERPGAPSPSRPKGENYPAG